MFLRLRVCRVGFVADVATCQDPAYVPTGACGDVIKQGLQATTNDRVSARFIDPQYAAGRAHQLATCIADLSILESGL
jgi:hypothetical protein